MSFLVNQSAREFGAFEMRDGDWSLLQTFEPHTGEVLCRDWDFSGVGGILSATNNDSVTFWFVLQNEHYALRSPNGFFKPGGLDVEAVKEKISSALDALKSTK